MPGIYIKIKSVSPKSANLSSSTTTMDSLEFRFCTVNGCSFNMKIIHDSLSCQRRAQSQKSNKFGNHKQNLIILIPLDREEKGLEMLIPRDARNTS